MGRSRGNLQWQQKALLWTQAWAHDAEYAAVEMLAIVTQKFLQSL